MEYFFRKADLSDLSQIWQIIQQAILRRKLDGSQQWQNAYPNEQILKADIENGHGYVGTINGNVAAYTAILVNDEPAYANIKGAWLSNEDFLVLHRLAVSDQHLGKGLAQRLLSDTETLAVQKHIFSIKVDTNFDNIPMLSIFKKMGYTYCGEVFLSGGVRMAFEKVLDKP